MNDFTRILEAFPNESWQWGFVTANPNITPEYIENHPEFPWHIENDQPGYGLTDNPNITLQYVLDHPELNWNMLPHNPGITLQDMEEHPNLFSTSNPNITTDFILKHRDKFKNKTLYHFPKDLKLADATILVGPNNPDYSFSTGMFLRIEDFTLQITRYSLLDCPDITLDYIFDMKLFHDIQFELWRIMEHPNFTFEDLSNYPGTSKLVPRYNLFKNPNVTSDIIKNILALDKQHFIQESEDIYYNAMSSNPNLTAEEVLINPDKKWNFFAISFNKFACHKGFMEPIVIRI